MKFLLLLTVILAQSAFALDWTQSDSRDIYDLMYLPDEGTKFVSPSMNFLGYRTEKKRNNIKEAETENKGFALEFAGGYVFKKNMLAMLDFNYLFFSKTEYDNINVGDHEEDSKGLSDPTLSFKWRALEQADKKVNLDLIPFYVVKSGDRKAPSEDQDGNNKVGGQVYGFTLQVGKKYSKWQYNGFFKLSNYSKSDFDPNGTKGERNSYETGAQIQLTLAPKWFFSFLGSYTNTDAHKEKFDNGEYFQFPRVRQIRIQPEFFYYYDANFAPYFRWELLQAAYYKTVDETGATTEFGKTGYSKISIGARYQF